MYDHFVLMYWHDVERWPFLRDVLCHMIRISQFLCNANMMPDLVALCGGVGLVLYMTASYSG